MLVTIIKIGFTILLMCGLTAALWMIENRTMFAKRHPRLFTGLTGILFGCAAIFATHFSVHYENMTVNVRDMAPLTAGLLFNPWAGIIAGLIGGIERYYAGTVLSIGAYTCVACSIATVFAGFLGAFLRRYLFDNKRTTAFFSFAIGAVTEVFHMLMILMTHTHDIVFAFHVVEIIALIMIISTGIGTMAASVLISALSGQYKKGLYIREKDQVPITRTIQGWLLLFCVAAFFFTFSFGYWFQTLTTINNAETLMTLNADAIKNNVEVNQQSLNGAMQLMKQKALMAAHIVGQEVDRIMERSRVTNANLQTIADRYDLYVIDLIDENGIVTACTNKDHIGFDMASGSQSAEFLGLLDGSITELVQDFQPISLNSAESIMFAGVPTNTGFVQVGYGSKEIDEARSLADLSTLVSEWRIGKTGKLMLLNQDDIITTGNASDIGKPAADLGINSLWESGTFSFQTINGVPGYCYFEREGTYSVLMMMPETELYEERDIFAMTTAFIEILLFTLVFVVIYWLVKKIIIDNLHRINQSLAKITNGNLNEVVNVRSNAEFASLSQDINATVTTLKRYIKEAEKRIDKELEFAREIQSSALPNGAPSFPNHDEFVLGAMMDSAKEVGGDFYDYFFVDEKNLVLVIADVSGKGIPASLFMMRSKTLLKGLAESQRFTTAEILEKANENLCSGNDAEMFVTVWIGILDITTGEMNCANAGHEFPAICRADGSYELIRDKHGLVLAGMLGVKYTEYNLKLNKGDKLFVYTDGVPEATDAENELYGTDRMLSVLNNHKGVSPQELLSAVLNDIDAFVKDAPQFDDITMLSLMMRNREE